MRTPFTLTLVLCLTTATLSGAAAGGPPRAAQAIAAPVLKWESGGCYSSWCETGWYASPAVADLDHDGQAEVIAAAYSLFILNGSTGKQKQLIAPPVSNARVWPGVVVADINGDGEKEIVTASGAGYVRVLAHTGQVLWTRQPATNELRSLAVYDLDGDGQLEVLVAVAAGINTNQWYVYQADGTLRAGWPQLTAGSPGYAAGCYNANIGVGDLNGDGRGEIIGPSDVHYITAYQANGAQIPANARYNAFNPKGPKFWSQVGVHVADAVDLRGYANCGTEHRPNFADSAPTLADVNRDGTLEVIVVGNNYNCGTDPYTDLYHMPYIFNADRSRWSGSGFDWTAIPTPDAKAAPLSEDYNRIETALPNPVAADLDGDGRLEILYASYDGRVHAYWLDKAEHGAWPYSVYNPAEGFLRFASEPVVADLDNDGHAEVIFTSWAQKGTHQTGKLYILDYLGHPLQVMDLPPAFGSPDWNGALAAPTLADIDGDGELEVVVNTAHSGVAAYDLPGTSQARVLWGTGRGNYQRTGSILYGSVQTSALSAQPLTPTAGAVLTYTLVLRNPGPALPGVRVTDTLPAEGSYAGNVWASAGSYGYSAGLGPSGTITWTGSVAAGVPVTLTFGLQVSAAYTTAHAIANTALIDDGLGQVWPRAALVVVNGYSLFLPLARR